MTNEKNGPFILYVDDERPNRVVFEQSFGRRFPVRTVSSAKEALEQLKNGDVGVLVTDQRMPDMNGNELLLRVKELYPSVVRVVVTAYSDLDPILRSVNDGLVARYIVKPWDRLELEEILRWGLEAYTLGQQNSALQLRLMQTERLVTLGSIGAAVFHDINQPLAYLTSNTERLRQLTGGSTDLQTLLAQHGNTLPLAARTRLQDLANELPAIVADMQEGCGVMNGLTNTIRRMLKPAVVQGTPRTNPLEVIRYAIACCRDIALNARGTIIYDGSTELPLVAMGSTELTQVLINLVANAAQALVAKGTPQGRVTVTAVVAADTVRIVVNDTGVGMTEETLAKVGTPFFSTRAEGTGLGVAQCRRLVEKAGGTFTLTSVQGQGSTAQITVQRSP